MMKFFLLSVLTLTLEPAFGWGFYGHRKINELAIFLLPPEMMVLFKPNASYIIEHSIDPDKRRYAVPYEGPRHYIDIDQYGDYPYDSLPRKWNDAVKKYGIDTLNAHGIVPWWLNTMLYRLTDAFKNKDKSRILRYAAEIGHYLADAHVPLHATRNHNGQLSGQRGIHGFWESRIPELLAEKEFDFFIGKASFIRDPSAFAWARVLESAAAADTVLKKEQELNLRFPPDQKYAFEERNGVVLRQYSSSYTIAYNNILDGMVERRMRQSIFAVASFWYTAWINAGQPDLKPLLNREFNQVAEEEMNMMNIYWKNPFLKPREHE
jgi:hypothetical protein